MMTLHRSTLWKRSGRGGMRIRRGGRSSGAGWPRGRVLLLALLSLLLLPLLRDRNQIRPESEAVAASDTGSTDVSFPRIAILRYGHVGDGPKAQPDAVPPDTLRAHIRSARAAGWTFVPLSELIARREHPEELPERTMVLTFDGGDRSFAERALPLLREEGVPAAVAIVTNFVEYPPDGAPPVMSWREIFALDHDDDVEVISNTHALHEWIPGNPNGDRTPSVTTRRWYTNVDHYEDANDYQERIRRDMRNARAMMRIQLGHEVHVLAWPYGAHNDAARRLAAEYGFTTTLALGDRLVSREDLASGVLPRFRVDRDVPVGAADAAWIRPARPPLRAARVDLDAVYDDDPAVFARNAEATVDELKRLGATHVFLQACPDPNGDGFLGRAWFMNHQAPVRADVWSAMAARLHREGMQVWIRTPAMNLAWAWQKHPEWRIPFRGSRRGLTPWAFRLSPDLEEARAAAADWFTELAVYLPVDGVLFDDDAYMLPGERLAGNDAGDAAAKSEAMRAYLEAARRAVRAWRPDCLFGRSLYAPVVEKDGVNAQLAQDFEASLADDDLTVVMAYPYVEDHARDAEHWVGALARAAERRWASLRGRRVPPAVLGSYPPVLFELQAYDWDGDAWVKGRDVLAAAREARRGGIAHIGVRPVIAGQGDLPDDLLQVPGAPEPLALANR